MKIKTSFALVAQLACVFGVSACDDDDSRTTSDGGPDGGGADVTVSACPSVGTGSLAVVVAGLPAGVAAVGSATGPDGVPKPLTATATLAVPAGLYAITAARVVVPDPRVRSVYDGVAAPTSVCVPNGGMGNAALNYAMIPTSNKLWVGTTGEGVSFAGFASATLAASGSPAATVAANTNGSGGFAFDRDGNVWIVGGTTADPPLARFRANTLGTGGNKTPDVTLTSAAFTAGSPGAKDAAFDGAGNLWVTTGAARKIVKFTPAQLAAGGTAVPSVEISGLAGLESLAFDGSGNLWAGYSEGLGFVSAAALAASRMGVEFTLDAQSGPPVIGSFGTPDGLAFDAAGNLWGAFGVRLVKLTAADLAIPAGGATEKVVTPAVVLDVGVLSLPKGIAFDEGQGLWMAGSQGKFIRIAPAQLATSGAATADVVVTSPSIGYAASVGIYPAPAASPLYHRLP
ncbi:MAG: hypothetical protein SF187_18965 [Deltaproteobacteria bacterium]|nr:hypothetical protein [Deltaproteobacteria bacterium]